METKTRLLSDRQYELMTEYDRDSEQRLADIAGRWDVSVASVHHVVNAMIKRGLLVRNENGSGYTPTQAWRIIRDGEAVGR